MWWVVAIITGLAAVGSIYLWWQFMATIFRTLFEGPYA